MQKKSELNIGLVGFGTVGTGVARILEKQADLIAVRAGCRITIRHVVARDAAKPRDHLPAGITVSDTIDAVRSDPEVDLVVQLMGGIDPAFEYARSFLEAGKDIVTANKALIYQHGPELFQQAGKLGRTIGFEAAVAGGIPIISAITHALTANRILSIEAILNGTSNFILTHMLNDRHSYEDVLQEAQRLGYAEADPAMDVDGTDAAQKLSILTQLSFATRVPLDGFVRQGIENLQLLDLQVADELGYKIKLLATSRIADGGLEMSVQPTLIRASRTIAQIDGADNIVVITGDSAGRTILSGAGAGQLPTASAVVADIIDYATGRASVTFEAIQRTESCSALAVEPPADLSRRYYLRFNVDDRPHVLADVADILGRHDISISSVRQDETPDTDDPNQAVARLVIMTHRTTEGCLQAAQEELNSLACVRDGSIRLPVAD